MNPELISVPGLAALATRRLARGNFEVLRLEGSEAIDNRGGDCIPEDELAPSW